MEPPPTARGSEDALYLLKPAMRCGNDSASVSWRAVAIPCHAGEETVTTGAHGAHGGHRRARPVTVDANFGGAAIATEMSRRTPAVPTSAGDLAFRALGDLARRLPLQAAMQTRRMRALTALSFLFWTAVLSTSAGCPISECDNLATFVLPGELVDGVDPRDGLGTVAGPFTNELSWRQTGASTAVSMTVAAANQAAEASKDCDGQPTGFQVPVTIHVATADSRLDEMLATSLPVDLTPTATFPAVATATFPAADLVGKGVVSDAILNPVASSGVVGVTFTFSKSAGVVAVTGSMVLVGGGSVDIAAFQPGPGS